ncbi:nuclear transport factor 2 family protein [Dactylosporangium salmoneum]|uniref:SnoaL-like domain-containing protein n=1 Tax=Dactylosporangium salmoneum TaxID=53361 RepID=A0ABN3GUH2_9ACTN
MPDEPRRKAIAADYFRRLNDGDVDAVVELFAPEGRIEHPLGRPARRGRDAQRDYAAAQIRDQVRIETGLMVAAQDDRQVVVPHTVSRGGGPDRPAIGILRIGPSGLIEQLRILEGTDR